MKATPYNRSHLLFKLSGNFSKNFERSLVDFSIEEQIHITNMLIDAAQRFEKDKDEEEYENIYNSTIDVLQKKYRKKLTPLMNYHLSDYFVQSSLKLLDQMTDDKINDDYHQHMDDEEYKNYMQRVKNTLYNYRSALLMQSDPEDETGKQLLGEKENMDSKGKKEPTARQRALFIHYLDKHFKINATGDKKPLADVAHFLTGNNLKNLYDTIKNPLEHTEEQKKSVQHLKNDLECVKKQFERLRLTQVNLIIDKDINSLK